MTLATDQAARLLLNHYINAPGEVTLLEAKEACVRNLQTGGAVTPDSLRSVDVAMLNLAAAFRACGLQVSRLPAVKVRYVDTELCGLVLEIVSRASGLPKSRITGSCRLHDIVCARWVSIWLLIKAGLTKSRIARLFALDYSTVYNSLVKLPDNLRQDTELSRLLRRCEADFDALGLEVAS